MGNANTKTSRSCVPGANNNNNSDKAHFATGGTTTFDERIDALVLRLHEVFIVFLFFLLLSMRSSAPSPFFFSSPQVRESFEKM